MSAAILFAVLACIAVYIVWCDERDQFELAVRRAHECGHARFIYCLADEILSSGAMVAFKIKLEVFDFEREVSQP